MNFRKNTTLKIVREFERKFIEFKKSSPNCKKVIDFETNVDWICKTFIEFEENVHPIFKKFIDFENKLIKLEKSFIHLKNSSLIFKKFI